MVGKQDYTIHTTDEEKQYRLLDGSVRVEILKGTAQALAVQSLRQIAEEIEKTPTSTWDRWDQGAK